MTDVPLTWRRVPASIRTVARWATIVNAAGYAVAIAFVRHTTQLTPAGAATRYRGGDPAAPATGAMHFPKPLAEMLLSTHTHLLGMTTLFVISGLCFALCPRPSGRWKAFLLVEPFAATLITFVAIWLTRFVDERFAWLLFLSSTSMALVFAIQTAVTLRALHAADRDRDG